MNSETSRDVIAADNFHGAGGGSFFKVKASPAVGQQTHLGVGADRAGKENLLRGNAAAGLHRNG